MTDFPAGRWRARWIWADPATAPDPGARDRPTVAFRHVVTLDQVPERVPARMSAVARYALWVNGEEAARGPVRAGPGQQPYDDLDLAPYLRPGRNVLRVVAWRYDGANPWWLPPSPFANDLGQGAFVFEARAGADWIVSDQDWQATVLHGWGATAGGRIAGRGRELIDARSLPPDAAEDPGWPAAIRRRALSTGEPGRCEPPSFPVGPFGPRPIGWPDLVDERLTPTGDRTFVAGRIVSGTLRVEVSGPAGAEIVLSVAEFLDPHGDPAPGEHDASVSITLDGTRRTVETLDLFGLRGVLIELPDHATGATVHSATVHSATVHSATVHSATVHSATVHSATVHSVTVRQRSYPVSGDAVFACSDDRLDQIWRVGRRTVTLCSTDAYIDCPTREQRAWAGDSVVHQLVDLATNTDWRLARWNPRLVASPRPDGMLPMAVAGDVEQADFTVIPDWALHWVHSVWNLYRYVGDAAEIGELLPVAERVVRWFERFTDASGLPTDVPGWVIIDWSSVYTEGISTALCGLWGRALREFAEMAAWLGDEGRARWARQVHERLATGFERLWDPDRQRYVDSTVAGVRRPMASQHGQAAAIVGGLAPRERWARLVTLLTERDGQVDAAFSAPHGPAAPNSDTPVGGDHLRTGQPDAWWDVDRGLVRAQPFFRYVVHDALAGAGRADLIAEQCLDWTVALRRCDTSWTETWYGGTVSHGWSSTPTRDLMTRVLGVEPAEPGFAVARIDPALGFLDWASGSVPCPAGLISVTATRGGLRVVSPVPFVHAGQWYPAGTHEF